ncbi:hypothetical protein QE152_g35237 [Popillia japonica]|uniref:Uncharacterized protein n=1 Tax=Popillia japonica TaxID=7064 RepID=A0AAW1IF86_POPJA
MSEIYNILETRSKEEEEKFNNIRHHCRGQLKGGLKSAIEAPILSCETHSPFISIDSYKRKSEKIMLYHSNRMSSCIYKKVGHLCAICIFVKHCETVQTTS